MSGRSPTVLILGASRGLGLGVAGGYLRRGWQVIATAECPAEGKARLHDLAKQSSKPIEIEDLDITDESQVSAMASRLSDVQIDVLFVNAGISRGPDETADTLKRDDFIDLLVTNALSPIVAINTLRPLVKEDGVIVVMSSNLASITNNTDGGWESTARAKRL